MATYTANLRLVLPATGEYPGTWGVQANTGLTNLVDTSVAGTANISMTAADYVLSTANGVADEARAAILSLGGTPGGAYNVIVPAVSKLYVVYNNTGHDQTVKTPAGSGISVPNGATAYLRCNGTSIVTAVDFFGSALPVSSGGTGAATLTGLVKGNGTGAFTAVTAPTGTVVGTSDTQTLTNKTMTSYTETVFAITDGSTVDLDPNNGPIQTWTLGANRTPGQANWSNGQSITLMVDDGTAFTISWTTLSVAWKTDGGSAPTLNTSGFTIISLWKVGGVIYGARVGDA